MPDEENTQEEAEDESPTEDESPEAKPPPNKGYAVGSLQRQVK